MNVPPAGGPVSSCATRDERTRLIYEEIPGCSPPPFFNLSTQSSLKSYEATGVVLNRWSKALLGIALRLSGAIALQRDPVKVEHLFRSVSLRHNHFAPVMSATAALADHPSPIESLNRAAALLLAAQSMHRDLVSGRFPPDQYRGKHLEMGQYANLFSTHIIHDGKRFRLFKSTCTSQITVLSRGRIYAIDFGPSDAMWTESALVEALARIAALSAKTKASELAPAVLSAARPETQSGILTELSTDVTASQALDTLRHSFVTLCLDLDSAPSSEAEAATLAQAGNFENRWYNSALQIVVFGNSKACLISNFNAYLDGNVQMRGASEIWQRSTMRNPEDPSHGDEQTPVVREIVIPVRPELLDKARSDFSAVLHHQQSTFELAGFGQPFFASRGLTPVPAFVAALQLAILRITGRTPRIGQLLSMSKYRYMDLSLAIVTTPEMIRFVESIESNTVSRAAQKELLRAAMDSQVAACRKTRQSFPLPRLPAMIAESTGGVRRLFITCLMKATNLALRKLGLAESGRIDIIISHPRIFDEVRVIGRPGTRLPDVSCFALHYQVLETSIVLTWIPGMDWKTPNREMTDEVVKALQHVGSIAEIDSPAAGQA